MLLFWSFGGWWLKNKKYSDYYINQNILIFNSLSCFEEHYIYSILDLPPASIDLLISPVPAHLSRSSFRNQIRKANTAVVRLSDRHCAHSWRRKAVQRRPPSHAALKMENKLISGLISYFYKTSTASLRSLYSDCFQAFTPNNLMTSASVCFNWGWYKPGLRTLTLSCFLIL